MTEKPKPKRRWLTILNCAALVLAVALCGLWYKRMFILGHLTGASWPPAREYAIQSLKENSEQAAEALPGLSKNFHDPNLQWLAAEIMKASKTYPPNTIKALLDILADDTQTHKTAIMALGLAGQACSMDDQYFHHEEEITHALIALYPDPFNSVSLEIIQNLGKVGYKFPETKAFLLRISKDSSSHILAYNAMERLKYIKKFYGLEKEYEPNPAYYGKLLSSPLPKENYFAAQMLEDMGQAAKPALADLMAVIMPTHKTSDDTEYYSKGAVANILRAHPAAILDPGILKTIEALIEAEGPINWETAAAFLSLGPKIEQIDTLLLKIANTKKGYGAKYDARKELENRGYHPNLWLNIKEPIDFEPKTPAQMYAE